MGSADGLGGHPKEDRMSHRAPALFVGHGSPMNAIEDTPSARGWAEIARAFPTPNAIVVVSAHWVTEGVRVTSNAQPKTIHDFGRGFPQELFDVQYPAPGDPELAQDIVDVLAPFGAQLDDSWGLDHGAWSVLRRMYPDADVPVVQVSLDARRAPKEHYAIGKALASLRDDDILILAAGNIVHNLPAFFRTKQLEPWVKSFDDLVTGAAVKADDDAVLNYATHPDAREAAPDWEHFFPVFYALAARRDGETAYIFNRHYEPGISMTAFAYGLPQ
jgi:4,5-DOPA dioxygenase extradiol